MAMDMHESSFQESSIQGHANVTLNQIMETELTFALQNVAECNPEHLFSTLVADHVPDQKGHDPSQSDHCDHGISHLVTLVSSLRSAVNHKHHIISAKRDDTFPTISFTPPYRPPII
jgi:hypothetical protein